MEHVNTPTFIYYANMLPCLVRKKCVLGTSYGTVKKISSAQVFRILVSVLVTSLKHNDLHLNSVKNIIVL